MTTERAGIPAKYKWDLSAISRRGGIFGRILGNRADGASTRNTRAPCSVGPGAGRRLADHYAIDRKMAKLYEYAARNFDVDTSVNAGGPDRKGINLSSRFMAAACSLFLICSNSTQKLEQWYLACPKCRNTAGLSRWLRRKPYVLSDECESWVPGCVRGLSRMSASTGS